MQRSIRHAPAAVVVSLLVPPAFALAGGAPAQAATVRVTARTIEVATASGRLVADRSGVRIRVLRPDGRTVLSTAAGDVESGGTRYAPLVLATGAEPDLRWPFLPGVPDPNPIGAPAPARYAALAPMAARRAGDGAQVTYRTDDPAGRRILVTLAPGPGRTLSLGVRAIGARGTTSVAAAFSSPRGEAFHGLGGRRESTDLRGLSVAGWVLDYRFPDPSTGYYWVAPSLVSSRGYGLLLDRDEMARWRLDSDRADAWRVSTKAAAMRLLVAPGSPAGAASALSALTGRQRVPPAWSLGPTLSRTVQTVTETLATYRARVQDDLRRIQRTRLPLSAYAFEGWARLPRTFVRATIRRLRARGIHAVLYLRSFLSNDRAFTDPPGVYDVAVRHGWVARHADGTPYLFDSPFIGAKAAVIDFTNPSARRWWRQRVFDLLDTGADGFMSDFGEQVLPDMRFYDGRDGAQLHNRYPVLQSAVTRAALDAYVRMHPGRRPYFFTRAGLAGLGGSAGYENATFPGDETNDWDRATGLPSIVPDMLNRAVAGAFGFTTDIGGYADFRFEHGGWRRTSKELFLRWSEAAVFTTGFRVHNSALGGVKMPWSYDHATLRAWAALARLHLRAEPLMLRLWRRATRDGVPPIRPLWMADSAAPVARADDEWLVGRDLLAAPVLRPGARSRAVWLPRGCWRLRGRGPALRGRTATVPAPLGQAVWLERCGTRPLA